MHKHSIRTTQWGLINSLRAFSKPSEPRFSPLVNRKLNLQGNRNQLHAFLQN